MSIFSSVELGKIADFRAGFGFSKTLQGKTEGEYPFVKTSDLSKTARLGETEISKAENYVDEIDLHTLKAKPLPTGAIVFSKIGEAIRQNFRIITSRPLLIDNNLMGLIPKNNLVDHKYLFWFMRQLDLYNLASTTAVPALRKTDLESIKVPLPPLPEQRRIAAILDKADAIRRKRQRAIALTEEFLRSAFLEMFGDPVTNPKGWPRVLCEDLCRQITVGIVVKPASYYVESGIPALRSLNIGINKIQKEDDFVYFSPKDNESKLSKTRVYTGDLVLVRSGQPGKAAVITDKFNGTNCIDLLIARPKKELINPWYLSNFFNSPGGKNLVTSNERGQIQKHLNVGSLNSAEIPVPPLNLQYKFAEIYEKVEKSRERLLVSSKAFELLFNGLAHRAFHGKLTAEHAGELLNEAAAG